MKDDLGSEQGTSRNGGSTRARRLVVFCGRGAPPSTTEAVESIADAHSDWQILIVHGSGNRRRAWPYLKSKLRRLGNEPMSYPLELLCETVAKISPAPSRHVGGNVGLPPLSNLGRHNVLYCATESMHDEEALKTVRKFRPWLGICLGAPILKPRLFEIPELGTINVHKSYLPDYRGMPPGFWELHDGADSTGVSVHWVARGLDTGDIIDQVRLPIPPYAVPGSIRPQSDEISIQLLLSVLDRLDSGEFPRVAQGRPKTPIRSRPPFILFHSVKRRLARKRSPARGFSGRLRHFGKACVQTAYVYAWASVRNFANRLKGKSHVTILVYHRVADSYLDDVTVGVQQFCEHLRLLKTSYDVLDMEEFLAARGKPRRRPAMVITFDDGYESAYLAARLLRREGLPATFFISTRIVGSDQAFPHDIQKLGKRVPALSWSQVRQMSRWGFHIGIHTASHANVGKIPFVEARTEICTSIDDVVVRLGRKGPETWFAYPYGKQDDITTDVRAALRDLGVEYCLSAYGGVNAPDFDPLDIKRQGVDWKYSLLALRAVVEGWGIR